MLALSRLVPAALRFGAPFALVLAAGLTAPAAHAAPPTEPAQRTALIGQPKALLVQPEGLRLTGPRSRQQVVVTGQYDDGSVRDLTALCDFRCESDVAAVTAGDAERFADWLRSEYAQATAARTLKRIKQLFARAVKDKLVDSNPFDGIRPGGMSNPARLKYITAAEITRVLDAAPNWARSLSAGSPRSIPLKLPAAIGASPVACSATTRPAFTTATR